MSDSLAGKLLVASPGLVDPNFARTVVLVCSHDANGAFGLVLNRPLEEAPVREHVPDWSGYVPAPAVLFQGGPVEQTAGLGLALGLSEEEPAGWTPVTGRIGLVDLSRLPGTDGSALIERIRIFVGYSGWGPGQLETELEGEGWFVVEAEPGDILVPEPKRLWRDVLRRQTGKLAMYAFFPEDPAVN